MAGRIEQLFSRKRRSTRNAIRLATGMCRNWWAVSPIIVLGILALIGLIPGTSFAVAVIVFGGSLALPCSNSFSILFKNDQVRRPLVGIFEMPCAHIEGRALCPAVVLAPSTTARRSSSKSTRP